jgi:hypothetical protein
MDIQLGEPRIVVLEERLTFPEIETRAMDRRVHAFGGGIGSLLQRVRPEEIELVTSQRRLDPFWHVACRAHWVYERTREYAVPASGVEVQAVTFRGERHEIAESGKGRVFRLSALEHCRDESTQSAFIDGLTGEPVADAATLIAGPQREIPDGGTVEAPDTIVRPPEHRASSVVRGVLAKTLKPIQADRIVEESVVIERTDLYYRPVWAFEFLWRSKDRRGVLEIDGLTGKEGRSGSLLAGVTKLVSKEALFDIGADTVGLIVPGGSIAVKVARAAIDRSY